MFITTGKGEDTPINLKWGDDYNSDTSDFTVVGPRKKKSARKIKTSVSRPRTRSQKTVEPTVDPGNAAKSPGRVTRGTGRKKILK